MFFGLVDLVLFLGDCIGWLFKESEKAPTEHSTDADEDVSRDGSGSSNRGDGPLSD